jgi:hypothetical protein
MKAIKFFKFEYAIIRDGVGIVEVFTTTQHGNHAIQAEVLANAAAYEVTKRHGSSAYYRKESCTETVADNVVYLVWQDNDERYEDHDRSLYAVCSTEDKALQAVEELKDSHGYSVIETWVINGPMINTTED